jgi:hypothetical protein
MDEGLPTSEIPVEQQIETEVPMLEEVIISDTPVID